MVDAKSIFDTIGSLDFFSGLPDEDIELIAGCGRNVRFEAGQYLARESAPADSFFVVRKGVVAIELYVPGQGSRVLETLHAGDIAGWSWIFPPYVWTFDIHAVEDVRAVAFDGKCLRGKCEQNPALGYRLMQRFAQIMSERIRMTRFRLLDLYSNGVGADAGLAEPPSKPGG